MSRPIKLTDQIFKTVMEEFAAAVKNMKMTDGNVSYTKTFKWKGEDRATLVFTERAYSKMMALVNGFSTEVAWHGTCRRDDEDSSKFIIDDILIYPQVVTGATVNTDQGPYQTWLYQLEDGVFNNLRMHGHSHVNFSTSPSKTDLDHQAKILSQLEDDMFYVFIIWNQKGEHTIKIYDLKNNTLYDDSDITVVVEGYQSFLKDAEEMVKRHTYTYTAATPPASKTPESKTAGASSDIKTKPKSSSFDDLDEYPYGDYKYGGYGGYGAYGGYYGSMK